MGLAMSARFRYNRENDGVFGDRPMEILYYTKEAADDAVPCRDIRWLSVGDYAVFLEHLELCGQRILEESEWKSAYREGTVYCGLFEDGRMVARACVEKYSSNAWEIADVRTARPYRDKGYAGLVCGFVLRYILNHGKTATIRTEEDNEIMKKVIGKLGFSVL
jgi:predicted GNAT family acetyltransferase